MCIVLEIAINFKLKGQDILKSLGQHGKSAKKKNSIKGLSFHLPYNFATFLSNQIHIVELLKQKLEQKSEEYPTQFAKVYEERKDATFLSASLVAFTYNNCPYL